MSNSTENSDSPSQVIAVDLDGTITFTDTLYETVLALVRDNPLFLFLLPFWLFKGKAYLKLKVAEKCTLDVTILPYNRPFIKWLSEQKICGKKIVLCTAANRHIAQAIAEHLNLFDDVISSEANTNLKGSKKREVLDGLYGKKGYDYAGNDNTDIDVWVNARNAIVVNTSQALQKKASKVSTVSKFFPKEGFEISVWFRALRIHQWLKNFLLFVPLLAAHQLNSFATLTSVIIAFFSFSLYASSVYIMNDLLDLESDRKHKSKRYRPFASAKLPITNGFIISPFLISLSILLAMMVGSEFLFVLLFYFFLTGAYSLVLKRMVLVDCLTLATLYTLRIIAGAAAASLTISFWLIAFSVFIFLSLALVKRYAELIVLANAGESTAQGRGYIASDAPFLLTLGVSSGYISALVIALYMRSEEVLSMYSQPIIIWLVIPVLIFWISWVWLKSARGEMHDDPIIFAVKDKSSLVVAIIIAVIYVCATTGTSF